jgi:microcystin-dependent protein
MSEPFLGELRMMSFNFPPQGWALANGQFLPIAQNQALFSLLGTTYGGNGQTTFALPDLRGRTPIHMSQGFTLGQAGGEVFHAVTQSEMPAHNHLAMASTDVGTAIIAAGKVLGTTPNQIYSAFSALTTLNPNTVTSTGGSQPHTNMQPYTVLSFCIALQGIFPSQN